MDAGNRRNRGFTLAEVLVVVGCFLLLMGPVIRVLSSGTQASLKGMVSLDTVLTGQRLIQQIHDDLRLACADTRTFPPKDTQGQEILLPLDRILLKSTVSEGETSYRFLAFPFHCRISEAVPGYDGENAPPAEGNPSVFFRRTAEIEYRFTENQPGRQAGKLVRIERFENHEDKRILSSLISNFEIARKEKHFSITVQLFSKNPSLIREREHDAIVEFFDVVSPDFYSAYLSQATRRMNWNTRLMGPERSPLSGSAPTTR